MNRWDLLQELKKEISITLSDARPIGDLNFKIDEIIISLNELRDKINRVFGEDDTPEK